MFTHKHLQQKYYKALLYAMTYHDEVSILNFNAKLLLVVFCLFVGFFYSPNIREPSSTCCMPLHVTSQVQEVPIDLVAAGYAALCDFFSGQSNKDPRLDPSYSRSFKQETGQTSYKNLPSCRGNELLMPQAYALLTRFDVACQERYFKTS